MFKKLSNIEKKRAKIRKILDKTQGQFFTVEIYLKGRWNKGEKEVVCRNGRLGVSVYTTGGKNTIDGKSDLLIMHEAGKAEDGYRTLWLDGVISITHKGKTTPFDVFPEFVGA